MITEKIATPMLPSSSVERGDFVKTMLDMNGMAYDVLLEKDINIQVLPVWESEWACPEAYSNPHLLKNIDRDGISL